MMALCAVTAAAAQSVNVDAPSAQRVSDAGAAPTGDMQSTRFRSTMDRVFGPGRWRQTSGYRSPAQEDELRRQGAGAVAAGHRSRHSVGTPVAPGAYDIVVDGMSMQSAALKLRRSGETFDRVVVEGVHGAQGPHLHVEPNFAPATDPNPTPMGDDTIYARIVGGRRNPVLTRVSSAAARKN